MISDVRPYSRYKPSGVEWLESVPEHWDVVPLKRIGDFGGGAGFPLSAQGDIKEEILFAKVSDMNTIGNEHRINSTANSVSREVAGALGARVFPPRSIIFPKVGGALLTNKRRVLARDTCIDNNLMGCVVTAADPEFIFRIMTLLDLTRMAKPGPVPAIGEGEVREIRVAVPSRSEQVAIVRFLDHADRRIQRYIRAKQKLIALLEEQKQAIFYQAVTGRLNVRTGYAYPAYKPSGVVWVGDMPEHWSLVPNKVLLRERKALVGDRHADYDLLSLTKEGVIIRDISRGRGKFSADMRTYQEVRPGDLVFCLFDIPETPRTIGLSHHVGMITGAYTIFRSRDDVVGRFMEAFYVAIDDRKMLSPICSGLRNTIPSSRFLGIKTPIPPKEEQVAILEFLSSIGSKIDDAMAIARRQIGLLSEWRVRTVSDVVTGKLDVGRAFSLPADDAIISVDSAGHSTVSGELCSEMREATIEEERT